MAGKKTSSIVTPRCVAVWPKLTTPDEYEGEKAFKTGILLDPENAEHAAFIAKVNEAAQASFDEFMAESAKELETLKGAPKAKLKQARDEMELTTPITDEYDDEGEPTGRLIFNAKKKAAGVNKKTNKAWTATVPLFDARGTAIKSDVAIWGGSELRLEVTLFPYAMTGTKKAGVSGRLEAVQVLALSGGSAGGKFGVEEDGYIAEDQTEAFDDNDGGSATDDDEDF